MRRAGFAAVVTGALMIPGTLQACAVCYGNPESDMAKGAAAGVLVLMGIVLSVLVGIVGVAIFWMRRARDHSKRQPGTLGMNGKWLAADAE